MLDRTIVLQAFERLASRLHERGVQGEVCLLGGTAMMLAFDARPSTKDVDAIFHPSGLIRELAESVGRELGLPDNWLNDAAKGFLSERHDVQTGDLPQFPGLRVVAPTATYLLAMKCMASRVAAGEGGADDVADIRFLLRRIGIVDLDEALDVVAHYYPAARVPPRARFLLEELLTGPDRGGAS